MPKVKKRFRDKHSFKFYNKGDSYNHENEDRVASLIEKGFLEAKSKQPPQKEETKKPSSKKKSKK